MMLITAPRKRFLPVEPGNQWPVSAWPNVPNQGALRGQGNAGGSYSYVPGMPTNWSMYDDGTNGIWDYDFGRHGGEPYLDWRWYLGYPMSATFNMFGPRASICPPAANGQTWEVGCWVAWAPGTQTYPSQIGVAIDQVDASYNWLDTVSGVVFTSPATQISSDPYRPTRMAASLTIVQPSTAFVVPGIESSWPASACECRPRVYKPFLRRLS